MDSRRNGTLTPSFREAQDVRGNWGFYLALGILLILLGFGVISTSFYATIFSVIFFGIFLIAGGIVQVVQSFLARKWSGFLMMLLLGVLYILVGFLCVWHPIATAVNLTLWIAAFCFAVGLFRMLSSLIARFDHWGAIFFNGLVTFLLGLMIYIDWPLSGLWVIGLFVGIDMILSGSSWVFLSMSASQRK